MECKSGSPSPKASSGSSGQNAVDKPKSRCPVNMHITHREVIDAPGVDVFGQPIAEVKKAVDVPCPSCGRVMACIRLSQHLEKCMMNAGRHSSRVAVQKMRIGELEDTCLSDDDDVREPELEAAFGPLDRRGTRKRHRPMNGVSSRPAKAMKATTDGDADHDFHLDIASNTGAQASSSASSSTPSPHSVSLSTAGSNGSSECLQLSDGTQSAAERQPCAAATDGGSPANAVPIADELFRLDAAVRKTTLAETCAVVLEQDSKMCRGPISCELHTDDQRQLLRLRVDALMLDENDGEDAASHLADNESSGKGNLSQESGGGVESESLRVSSTWTSSPSAAESGVLEGPVRKARRRHRSS